MHFTTGVKSVKRLFFVHLFAHLWLPWHLEHHTILALKHFIWHFLGPPQWHLVNPCPPDTDRTMTIECKNTYLLRLTSSSESSFWGHKLTFGEPAIQDPSLNDNLVGLNVSRSLFTITKRMFHGSPLQRSSNGTSSATLFPGSPKLRSTWLLFIILST